MSSLSNTVSFLRRARIRNIYKILFLFIIISVFPIHLSVAAQALAKHVIVIGIDGLNARTLSKTYLPGIESLKTNGVYTLKARSINPSSSAPNWMTILTGSPVFAHGVESNNWRRDEYLLPPAMVGLEDIFPTIFSVLKQQKPNAVNPNQGLNVAYYEFPDDIDPVRLPDFDKIVTQSRPSVQEIDINSVEHRKEKYAIRFVGYIEIKTIGEYDFYTRSDDGSRLIIDKTAVVDNDGTHGIKEIAGRIKLNPGFHKVIVEYFQAGGGDFLNVLYKGPNVIQQIIPPDVLFKEIQAVG